jgi:hypothetical protein
MKHVEIPFQVNAPPLTPLKGSTLSSLSPTHPLAHSGLNYTPSGITATVGARELIILHSSSITCKIRPLKYYDLKLSIKSANENVSNLPFRLKKGKLPV